MESRDSFTVSESTSVLIPASDDLPTTVSNGGGGALNYSDVQSGKGGWLSAGKSKTFTSAQYVISEDGGSSVVTQR